LIPPARARGRELKAAMAAPFLMRVVTRVSRKKSAAAGEKPATAADAPVALTKPVYPGGWPKSSIFSYHRNNDLFR
jgi:hypothetical protein